MATVVCGDGYGGNVGGFGSGEGSCSGQIWWYSNRDGGLDSSPTAVAAWSVA